MKIIMFTKHLQGKDIDGLIEAIKTVGASGADLCVRAGYLVEPETIEKKLPEAVKKFKDAGLIIPIITTPGDFLDPNNPVVEKVLNACSNSEVKLIKLGYWRMSESGYWKTVENIRKNLEVFERLAKKYEVKVCIHNHSGGTMGLNSCSVMNLVKGFDPKYIGVFADPGHLSLVGEPLPMAFSINKEYLSIVAIKDLIRERYIDKDNNRLWRSRVVPLGEGFVDWRTLVKILFEIKFDGPVSVHSEYSELDIDSVIDQTRMDIRFFKKIYNKILEKGQA